MSILVVDEFDFDNAEVAHGGENDGNSPRKLGGGKKMKKNGSSRRELAKAELASDASIGKF